MGRQREQRPAFRKLDHVKVIAAHLAEGFVERLKLVSRQLVQFGGLKRLLDPARGI